MVWGKDVGNTLSRVVEGGCMGEVVGRMLGEEERGRRPYA